MSKQEVIDDLIALRDFFMEQSDGAYPVCLEEAIAIITNVQQAEEASE